MNKNLFGLVLLSIPFYITSQSQPVPQVTSETKQIEKSFEQVKKDYAAQNSVLKDITITGAAEATFFKDKTLENVTFNAGVTGDWKNVTLKGVITFTNLPVGNVDENTQKNKKATLVSKDSKTIKIDTITVNTLGFKY